MRGSGERVHCQQNDETTEGKPLREAFFSLTEARRLTKVWKQDYNILRSHSTLADISPEEYRRAVNGENTEATTTNFSLVHLAGQGHTHSCIPRL
ncbi:integrase core domain-containing protein [Nitratidesulfovibrio sp. 1201_IL3209]|uniref:integrase core domain-containing protein n=1 Tax=Nitratidesulfovibrio sp. 1201_IL3209 TaxID=3084053 RepID=UPI003FA596D0